MSQVRSKETRRPFLFALAGLLACVIAIYLIYDHQQPRSTVPGSNRYNYQIEQSATAAAHYTESAYFDASGLPGEDNAAYIQSLTDYLNSSLNYHFTGSETADLQYSYRADAVVRSTFVGKGDSADNAPSVWSQKYTLLEPVTGSQTARELTLNPSVTIPFAEYAAVASKFKAAYDVPVSSEVVATYTVEVSGEADGVPFANTQTTTITAPLDQRLYKIAVQFNKTDYQEVASKRSSQIEEIVTKYELAVAIVLLLLGAGAIVYGFRKQIVRSPYQRELARIYRYNEDIIVKARRPVSLTRKNIVDLESFDDLLSIQEESGLPIVANELSNGSTRFIITRDDTAYVFTLGGYTPEEDWGDNPPNKGKTNQ